MNRQSVKSKTRTTHSLYMLAGVIALATVLVYVRALGNDFVNWDDDAYIYENPHIRSLDAAFFKWAFSSFYASNWHPFTWISHALDYAVWGLNPLGHHLTTVVLHAFNAFLVVVLMVRLLEARKSNEGRTHSGSSSGFLNAPGMLLAAGVAGLLFGIHPVHVESVAWAAERKDVLCGLFFLLSLIAYVKYAQAAGSDETAPFFNKQYLASIAFFGAALLSKPMAVTLPIVLLILDWYPFSRIRSFQTAKKPILEKIPFLALSLIVSILTVIAQKEARSIAPLAAQAFPVRFQVAVTSLIAYLRNMLVPLDLLPFYPYPKTDGLSFMNGEFLLAAAAFSTITVLCIVLMKKQPLWLAAWLYYIITLAPVLGVIQAGDQAMADRYTYLPSLGLFLVVGTAAAWGMHQVRSRVGNRRGLAAAVAGIALAAFLFLSYLTLQQIEVWKNSVRLWSYVLEKEPEQVPLAYMNRGAAFQALGRFDEALADYNATILLEPANHDAYNNRGVLFDQMGDPEKAIADYTASIGLNGSVAHVYNNRARVYRETGRLEKALEDCNAAIRLNPGYAQAYVNRGRIFEKAGSFDRAFDDYSRAIAIDPGYIAAYNDRGILSALLGQYDRALDDYNTAVLLNPAFAQAYFNRAMLYARTNRPEPARADYQKACGLGYQQACYAVQR